METRPPDGNAGERSACKADTATVVLERLMSRAEEATAWNFHDPKDSRRNRTSTGIAFRANFVTTQRLGNFGNHAWLMRSLRME